MPTADIKVRALLRDAAAQLQLCMVHKPWKQQQQELGQQRGCSSGTSNIMAGRLAQPVAVLHVPLQPQVQPPGHGWIWLDLKFCQQVLLWAVSIAWHLVVSCSQASQF
jgi:hypothetical protein